MVSPLSVCMSSRLLQSGHVDISNGRSSCLLGVVGRELKTRQALRRRLRFQGLDNDAGD
jgi:hypothetical protein